MNRLPRVFLLSVIPAVALASCLVASLAPALAQGNSVATWAGQYRCAQGLTGLILTVSTDTSGQARALFDFHSILENPTLPEGCFEMSGTVTGRHLVLQPGAWRRHPQGYVTVGLTGDFGADGRLAGSVDWPGCTSFSLSRVTTPQAVGPMACSGAIS